MRNKKIIWASLAVIAVTGLGFSSIALSSSAVGVSAGASKSYIASSASVQDGSINTGDFLVKGGVHAEKSTVLFDEQCSANSKLVGKNKIRNLQDYGMGKLFEASLSIKVGTIVEDGSFSLSFGLPSVSSGSSETGSTELKFTSSGSSILLGITEHNSDGDKPIMAAEAIEALSASASFDFSCSVTGLFDLSIAGVSYLNDAALTSGGVGYFGFFSNGLNTVSLSDFDIYGYSYQAPENVDYTEFFDDGAYNANVFSSSSSLSGLTPSYLGVEKDTGALHFCNTGKAEFTTRYTYSNFEMEFDIPQLQREPTYDADGALTGLISNWFGIAWGVDNIDQDAGASVKISKWIQYEGTLISSTENPIDHSVKYDNPRLVLWDNGSALQVQPMDWNIFDNDLIQNQTVQIKISVVDGVFKLFNKLEKDVSYGAPVINFDMGETPDGHLRIFTWAPGSLDEAGFKYSSITNFSIDNLHIVNKDSDAVKKSVSDPGYTPNGITVPDDYDYTTVTDDSDLTPSLLPSSQPTTKAIVWVLPLIAAIIFIVRKQYA